MTDPIVDRLAIADVIIKYATSVDARDLQRYATCFTEDIVVTGFSGGELRGLGPYVEWVRTALARYSKTQHLVGNHEISINGDQAHMRTYIQATHVLADDETMLVVLWGIYDDDLVRTPEGWKITRHHLERLIEPRRIATSG
jgi:uncharacterized protein (TIGR02246 family)